MGTFVAMIGIAMFALAITLLRGPWQGGAIVVGALLLGLGVWMQRRKQFDWSSASADNADGVCLPGQMGSDPRPWLEQHGADSSGADSHDG